MVSLASGVSRLANRNPLRGRRPTEHQSQALGLYVGVVMDDQDEQSMGRLQVYIPQFSAGDALTDPSEQHSWFRIQPAHSFFGSNSGDQSDVDAFDGNTVSYGDWAQARTGDHVLVMFINGDPSRGVMLACLAKQYQNFMVPGVPGGTIEGQTNVDLPGKEINQNRKNQPRKSAGVIVDNMLRSGLATDELRGASSSGARRESPSRVTGRKTPGDPDSDQAGHQFVMDDLPENQLIRLRTSRGNQVLLCDTGQSIYISTALGNNWWELREDGHVDVYSSQSISHHAEKDINFVAGRDINFDVGRDVNCRVGGGVNQMIGGDYNVHVTGKHILGVAEYHLTATADTFLKATNINMTSTADTLVQAANVNLTATADAKIQSVNYGVTASGDYSVQGATVSATAQGDLRLQGGPDVFMNGGAGPAPAAPTAPAEPTAVTDPNTTDLPGVPTGDQILQGNQGSDVTFVAGSDGDMRVPQHEPWLLHDTIAPGTKGLVVEGNADPDIRVGSPLPDASQANDYVDGTGAIFQAVSFKTGSPTENPTYNKVGTTTMIPCNSCGVSNAGINLIKKFELFSPIVYDDNGKPAIGYGHDLQPGESFPKGIDEGRATELLLADLGTASAAIQSALGSAPLTQNQFDALISFTYNIGGGAFKSSTLAKKIIAGLYQLVPNEFMKWVFVSGKRNSGLRTRRQAEADLFSTPPGSQIST